MCSRVRHPVPFVTPILCRTVYSTRGYNGDAIPATQAELNTPTGVALDSAGSLFIADTDNNRLREVFGATGLITTVAGTGTPGYNGDNIPAAQAQLDFPEAAVLDGG